MSLRLGGAHESSVRHCLDDETWRRAYGELGGEGRHPADELINGLFSLLFEDSLRDSGAWLMCA